MMSTIANLHVLQQRKHALSVQAARYGISADPSISIELRDIETVIGLMERIDIHRQNLRLLLENRSRFGINTPTYISTQISTERAAIASLRRQCADAGYAVDRHEVDDDVQIAPPADTTPAPTQLDRIEAKLDELLREMKR